MTDLATGKPFMLTWMRARFSSDKAMEHLEKARAVARRSNSTKAASRGPYPGWNSQRQLSQVLEIMLDVTKANIGRSKITQTGMRILEHESASESKRS